MPAALAGLLGSAVGGIASAIGGDSKQNQTSTSTVDAGFAGQDEQNANRIQGQQLSQLEDFTNNAGPGLDDVRAGTQSARGLADLYGQYSKTGGLPGQQDIAGAQGFANSIFAPQQVALQQQMVQQQQASAKNSALLGRSSNDPILASKLAQEQTRQQNMLNAQKGAFGADYANQLVNNRLQLASQQTNVLGGLATQAMQNRSSLLSLGNQIKQQERDWRLATATRTTTGQQSTDVGPGDRASAGLSGAFSGFGAGLKTMGMFNGLRQNRSLGGQVGQMQLAGQQQAAPQWQPPQISETNIGPSANGDQYAKLLRKP